MADLAADPATALASGPRPAPLVTPENEFFWTSGADGRLRLAACETCAALIHPPQPVCRYCRGRARSGSAPVSGFATLIGFTVNHRFSLPGLPAPYVVAQVAIEEDPRVRLTTNAVGCDPGELALGMRMEVVFEQAGDVWLPLFRPAAEQGGAGARCPPTRSSPGRSCATCARWPAGEVRGQGRDHRHRGRPRSGAG